MKLHRVLVGLVFSASMLGISGLVHGQVTPGQPRPETPVAAARRQVTEAQTAVIAAKKALDAIRQKSVIAFKTAQPEYAKAEEELTKAKAELDAARLAAQAVARNKPEYKTASANKLAINEKLRATEDQRGAEYQALTAQYIEQSSIMNRFESQALDTDTRYLAAKTRLAEAQRAIEQYKAQIDEVAKADPEYMAAEQAVMAAEQQVAQAQMSLQQVVKSEADAARQRAASKRPPTPAPRPR